jgi:hypothetical protein
MVFRPMELDEPSKGQNPNPPYGAKGGFRKITLTLPPESYEKLIQESVRRKIAGAPNQLLSALLREAVTLYLSFLDVMEC